MCFKKKSHPLRLNVNTVNLKYGFALMIKKKNKVFLNVNLTTCADVSFPGK